MIVTIKTLQQQTFKVEVKESDTVASLKHKIESEKGPSYCASSLKLIYSGKILNDSSPLSDYNIQESNFIVVMVSKVKSVSDIPQNPGETSTTVDTSSSQPNTTQEGQAIPPATQSAEPSSSDLPSTVDTENIVQQAESTLCTGSDFEETLDRIVSFGFDRSEARNALTRNFNNPDRAASELLSGTSADTLRSETAQQQMSETPPAQSSQSTQGLSFLRNIPQFRDLQTMVRNNPSLLQPLLQELGQSNPQLLQIIQNNLQEFLQLLNDTEATTNTVGPLAIEVTPEEKEAIDRLKALGFEESLVIQAYFACDKNEELTANFLLQSD